MSDFRGEIPARAFLNVLIVDCAVTTDAFAECVRKVLEAAGESDTQYQFMNPAFTVGLLYSLIVVPKEIWILSKNDPVYQLLETNGCLVLFKINVDNMKREADDPPMRFLIHRLRNSVAHANYSIDQSQAFTFWNQPPRGGTRFWEGSISHNDLRTFLSKLAHCMIQHWRKLQVFTIDERYDYPRVQQFATQIAHVSDEEKELFESNFSNTQSDDFNLGLLAGLADAHTILSSGMSQQDKVNYIAHLVALVADKIAKRGV